MNGLTLVVMAAGMGSRFGGLKQMEPVGPDGEMILHYSIHDAGRSGVDRFVFVVQDGMQEAFLSRLGGGFTKGTPFDLVYQRASDVPGGRGYTGAAGREKPWGTGHAVWACRDRVKGPFCVINADDFYGAGAFRAMCRFLEQHARTPGRGVYGLAGYPLGGTLSPHGGVSRAVCQMGARGELLGLVEMGGIRWEGGEILCPAPGANTSGLRPDTPVSMNFWAFTPDVFPLLEREFDLFLRSSPGGGGPGEFYLPEAVGAMIRGGDAATHVVPVDSDWFGVTYKQDLERVRASVREMVARGEYPRMLSA